jgi:hypothetical protein
VCARSKAIGSVCLSAQKLPDLDIYASERLVNTTNPSKSSKIWLRYALNHVARPTSVANTAFLPIGHAYRFSPLQASEQPSTTCHLKYFNNEIFANYGTCMCSVELALIITRLTIDIVKPENLAASLYNF